MSSYRYTLDNTGKKYLCPDCKNNRFVRYIDTETNEYLPEKYGRCDRECNCGYHLNPYSDRFGTSAAKLHEFKPKPKTQQQANNFMPESILNATLKDYHKNVFIQNLLKSAPIEDIERLIGTYRLGTISTGERTGAITFPFIDKDGNIHTIQAKEFDETNHTTSTDFLHSILARYYTKKGEILPDWLNNYLKNDKKVSCLFGEHLLKKYPLNPVALVEAPKTAIIGTLYYDFPKTPNDLLWLAVYNKSSLTFEKCKALKGRNVVLFPDLNAFAEWNKRVKEFSIKLPGTRFIVSDILERHASPEDILNGLDLADYLTSFDCFEFRKLLPNTGIDLNPSIITETDNSNIHGEKGEKSETLIQIQITDDEIESPQLLSETFKHLIDCPILEGGEVISGAIGKSGRFYTPLPFGRTNVYLKAEDCAKGLKPDHTLDFSEWMEVKINDFDGWLSICKLY